MKIGRSKFDAYGRLKNGLIKEFFKDGTLSCVGEYRNGEKIGEWKYYLRNGLPKPSADFPMAK
jgi:antitoxin component YwqK of YwqJK toxin-antitoxin module